MTLNPFRPFWTYLKPYSRRILTGLLLLSIGQLASSAIPLALRETVDLVKERLDGAQGGIQLSEGSAGDQVVFWVLMILGLALAQMGLEMGMRWRLNSVSRFVEYDIRRDYFKALLRLSLSYFHQRPTGDLISRATNDMNAVRMFLGFGVRMLFGAVLGLTLSMLVMCWIDWKLAIFAVVPMPVMALVMSRLAGRVHHGFRSVQEQFSRISAHVQENLSGIRVVKAFAQGRAEMDAFDELSRDYLVKNRVLIRIQSLLFPLSLLISGASLAVILWVGGAHVIEGRLTLGDFVAFNAYLTKLIFPMITLGWMIDRYQRGLASMKRIEDILATTPEIQDSAHVRAVGSLRGEIEFRNLSFSYNGVPVLKNIDLHIPRGSTLALVGRVGSGKTTLVQLIPRLLQATRGAVLIDGIPVDEIPLATLRSSIGFVPQDTFLFSDSLRENICLGRDRATEADVLWASDVAGLSSDLSNFPQGIETVIGERGVTLSGGQKQRTALASGGDPST
jgi:ATP-binding cassette subfamily B multidrug efflux pump